MAAKDVGWHMHKGVWQRIVGGVWAFVRVTTGGYEIATGTNGNPDKWEYYCDAKGGTTDQEYKAKRRATAMARKLSRHAGCLF